MWHDYYMTTTRVRPGAKFVHRRQLADDDGGPNDRRYAMCVITAIRGGKVYYHAEPNGMAWKAALDAHGRWAGFEAEDVREWVS